MHRALAILVVAERFQRQPLQEGLFLGEHGSDLPLGSAMDARVGPVLFPVIEIRLRLFQALELLALQRCFLCVADTTFNFPFSIWIPYTARQRRYTVVRQNIAIKRIQAGIVDVSRQHAFAKVVQHHHARNAAQPAEGLLMQLGPHPRAGPEAKKSNRFAAVAQRQHEQPRAPVLAAYRIAHHRPGAVIDLALLARCGLDDRPRFRR